MKKLIICLVTFATIFSLVGCTTQPKKGGDYFIAIVTGTASQSEDELRGAEAFMDKYGKFEDGGIVKHATYPDNFTEEMETVITTISSFGDDPKCKAIVVDQGVPGTAAAFEKIRANRDDIILFIGSPHDDWQVAKDVCDLMIDPDNTARGYLMILAAKKMGAKKFVHVSFARHMSYAQLSRRAAIMAEACKDLGLEFIHETAPDPTKSDVGVAAAQQFILEQMPIWVEKYGKDTAFFCTNDAHTEPMLKKIAELGAIFVEPDLPSPIMGYPGAFGIDLKDEAGDWPAILAKVESAVVENGGGERMGTWAYSINYTAVLALSELAKRCIEGTADFTKFSDMMDCFEMYTPGARWNGSVFVDVDGVTRCENYFMLYQDTYVFGNTKYLNMIDEEVPAKYFTIK